ALEAAPRLIRAFVGIPLPEEHLALLAPYLRGAAEAQPAFRWVRPENLHVTLRFIGSVDGGLIERLGSLLESVAAPAFELSLDHLGSFGSGRLRRVIWLGAGAGAEQAGELAGHVERACVEAGLE